MYIRGAMKLLSRSFLTFILLAFISNRVSSQAVITINDTIDHQEFSYDHIQTFEDSEDVNDIYSIQKKEFKKNTDQEYPRNKNYPNTYWLKIRIKPDGYSQKKWFLEFYDQTIDGIVAYIPDQYGNYKEVIAGDAIPFNKRRFKHKNFVFEFPNDGKNTKTVFFKIKSHELNNFILVLRSHEKFIQYALTEYLFIGLMLGMIVIVSLFNFLTFFAIRKKQYLYYSFYILFVGLYEASQTGIAYQYLWPNSPAWNQVAFGIALYVVIILALLFTRSFLNLKEVSTKLCKYITYMIWLRSAWFIVALFFDNELFEFREIEILPLLLAFYVGFYCYQRKIIHARYFLGAYGLLFIGFLIKTLVNIDIIPFTVVTHYSITIAFLVEMLFLSLALGDKIKVIDYQRDRSQVLLISTLKEKEKLSTKVNRELEEKVKARTIALKEANEMLEKQAEQINKFNVDLDLKNRQLQKNVETNLNKRIMKKLVDFEEFKAIFPDKLSCYRYLEALKQKQDYNCLKCRNDKYFENIKKFSRRCTKCGYNESITTRTIFKGIKFPIEKAFYIVYLVVTDEKDLTIDKLAEILEMRSNTCWSFKKKVQQLFIDKKIKRKDIIGYDNWSFLITE